VGDKMDKALRSKRHNIHRLGPNYRDDMRNLRDSYLSKAEEAIEVPLDELVSFLRESQGWEYVWSSEFPDKKPNTFTTKKYSPLIFVINDDEEEIWMKAMFIDGDKDKTLRVYRDQRINSLYQELLERYRIVRR